LSGGVIGNLYVVGDYYVGSGTGQLRSYSEGLDGGSVSGRSGPHVEGYLGEALTVPWLEVVKHGYFVDESQGERGEVVGS
tara:strand:- start:13 stop:252 length:240 start_codon:yes stop_codon:yes gene_type:complete